MDYYTSFVQIHCIILLDTQWFHPWLVGASNLQQHVSDLRYSFPDPDLESPLSPNNSGSFSRESLERQQ